METALEFGAENSVSMIAKSAGAKNCKVLWEILSRQIPVYYYLEKYHSSVPSGAIYREDYTELHRWVRVPENVLMSVASKGIESLLYISTRGRGTVSHLFLAGEVQIKGGGTLIIGRKKSIESFEAVYVSNDDKLRLIAAMNLNTKDQSTLAKGRSGRGRAASGDNQTNVMKLVNKFWSGIRATDKKGLFTVSTNRLKFKKLAELFCESSEFKESDLKFSVDVIRRILSDNKADLPKI